MNSLFLEIILGEGRHEYFDYETLENLAFCNHRLKNLLTDKLRKKLSKIKYRTTWSHHTETIVERLEYTYYIKDGQEVKHGWEIIIYTDESSSECVKYFWWRGIKSF